MQEKNINMDDVATYLTGLVILAKAVPETLTDANGDPVRECMEQTLQDAAAELGLTQAVHWEAQGEPADTVQVAADTVTKLQRAARQLTAALENMPRGDADD